MGKYADSPAWADVAPLVQEDPSTTGALPLAQIAYSDDYAEAMSYLRAVMAADEKSDRVLELTEHIIRLNPAHYTVWLYRAATLQHLSSNLVHELTAFLNPLSLAHLKNYQIWHHRQTIMDRLYASTGSASASASAGPDAAKEQFDYKTEAAFLSQMFIKDAKNYHVWSYRQWLVRRFGLWDEPGEWAAVEQLLREDVRNNSAWNHRWYLAFARPDSGGGGTAALGDKARVQRELVFAMEQVAIAPQNASPWNYIRGLLSRATGDAVPSRRELVAFAQRYAGTSQQQALGDGSSGSGAIASATSNKGEAGVKSSHALELLAHLYLDSEAEAAEAAQQRSEAVRLLEMLADTYDPIRAPYWRYRIALVNGGRPAVAAVS